MTHYSRAVLLYVVNISVFNMPPFKEKDSGNIYRHHLMSLTEQKEKNPLVLEERERDRETERQRDGYRKFSQISDTFY